MVTRVGMIGLSEGNGHPFSFSAIVNGYDDAGFADSGWPGIHDYLRARSPGEFGFPGVRVTHAWTQDPVVTRKLCRAARIETAVDDLRALIGAVDAVIIARDDWPSHHPLARPFLEAGLPVFIDKPLSLDVRELAFFRPYLERGQLMSCSGLRFARELDELGDLGPVRCIDGAVVLDWERYGVHLLDAVFQRITARPVSIARHPAHHDALTIALDDGGVFNVNALGAAPKTFHLSFYGPDRCVHVDLRDNFSAFRRTLGAFFEMIKTGRPAIAAADTLLVMHTLRAGLVATKGGPHVRIDDSSLHQTI